MHSKLSQLPHKLRSKIGFLWSERFKLSQSGSSSTCWGVPNSERYWSAGNLQSKKHVCLSWNEFGTPPTRLTQGNPHCKTLLISKPCNFLQSGVMEIWLCVTPVREAEVGGRLSLIASLVRRYLLPPLPMLAPSPLSPTLSPQAHPCFLSDSVLLVWPCMVYAIVVPKDVNDDGQRKFIID